MKIILDKSLKTGLITEHNGVELQYHTKTWNKLKYENTEHVFGYLNMYWAKLPDRTQARIFNLYVRAHELLNNEDPTPHLKQELSEITTQILDLHNIDAMREHIHTLPPTHFPFIHPETMQDDYGTNPESQTYTKGDYMELVVISTIIKSLTPIWGSYNNLIVPSVGKDHKEIKCLDLIRSSKVYNSEAMDKLARFTETWVEGAKAKSQAAITKGIASVDLPYYFLAMNVVRRMPIQKFRNIDGKATPTSDDWQNMIRQIYNFTDGGKKEIMKGPGTKNISGGEGEELISIVEQYRTAQRVPDYIHVTQEEYVCDIDRFASHVLENYDAEKRKLVYALHKRVDSHEFFTRSDFHPPIFAKTVGRQIFYLSTIDMERKAIVAVSAVAAAKLMLLGLEDVAELIIAEKRDKDLHVMSMGGIPMNELTREYKEKLHEHYPYIPKASRSAKVVNPGISFIAETVKLMNQYDWSFDVDKMINLKTSLAKVLLLED